MKRFASRKRSVWPFHVDDTKKIIQEPPLTEFSGSAHVGDTIAVCLKNDCMNICDKQHFVGIELEFADLLFTPLHMALTHFLMGRLIIFENCKLFHEKQLG